MPESHTGRVLTNLGPTDISGRTISVYPRPPRPDPQMRGGPARCRSRGGRHVLGPRVSLFTRRPLGRVLSVEESGGGWLGSPSSVTSLPHWAPSGDGSRVLPAPCFLRSVTLTPTAGPLPSDRRGLGAFGTPGLGPSERFVWIHSLGKGRAWGVRSDGSP